MSGTGPVEFIYEESNNDSEGCFGDETQPKTLYVGNLDTQMTEEFLLVLFGQIGQVKGCKIIHEILLVLTWIFLASIQASFWNNNNNLKSRISKFRLRPQRQYSNNPLVQHSRVNQKPSIGSRYRLPVKAYSRPKKVKSHSMLQSPSYNHPTKVMAYSVHPPYRFIGPHSYFQQDEMIIPPKDQSLLLLEQQKQQEYHQNAINQQDYYQINPQQYDSNLGNDSSNYGYLSSSYTGWRPIVRPYYSSTYYRNHLQSQHQQGKDSNYVKKLESFPNDETNHQKYLLKNTNFKNFNKYRGGLKLKSEYSENQGVIVPNPKLISKNEKFRNSFGESSLPNLHEQTNIKPLSKFQTRLKQFMNSSSAATKNRQNSEQTTERPPNFQFPKFKMTKQSHNQRKRPGQHPENEPELDDLIKPSIYRGLSGNSIDSISATAPAASSDIKTSGKETPLNLKEKIKRVKNKLRGRGAKPDAYLSTEEVSQVFSNKPSNTSPSPSPFDTSVDSQNKQNSGETSSHQRPGPPYPQTKPSSPPSPSSSDDKIEGVKKYNSTTTASQYPLQKPIYSNNYQDHFDSPPKNFNSYFSRPSSNSKHYGNSKLRHENVAGKEKPNISGYKNIPFSTPPSSHFYSESPISVTPEIDNFYGGFGQSFSEGNSGIPNSNPVSFMAMPNSKPHVIHHTSIFDNRKPPPPYSSQQHMYNPFHNGPLPEYSNKFTTQQNFPPVGMENEYFGNNYVNNVRGNNGPRPKIVIMNFVPARPGGTRNSKIPEITTNYPVPPPSSTIFSYPNSNPTTFPPMRIFSHPAPFHHQQHQHQRKKPNPIHYVHSNDTISTTPYFISPASSSFSSNSGDQTRLDYSYRPKSEKGAFSNSYNNNNNYVYGNNEYEQIPNQFMDQLRPILSDQQIRTTSSAVASTTSKKHVYQSPEIHPPHYFFENFLKPMDNTYSMTSEKPYNFNGNYPNNYIHSPYDSYKSDSVPQVKFLKPNSSTTATPPRTILRPTKSTYSLPYPALHQEFSVITTVSPIQNANFFKTNLPKTWSWSKMKPEEHVGNGEKGISSTEIPYERFNNQREKLPTISENNDSSKSNIKKNIIFLDIENNRENDNFLSDNVISSTPSATSTTSPNYNTKPIYNKNIEITNKPQVHFIQSTETSIEINTGLQTTMKSNASSKSVFEDQIDVDDESDINTPKSIRMKIGGQRFSQLKYDNENEDQETPSMALSPTLKLKKYMKRRKPGFIKRRRIIPSSTNNSNHNNSDSDSSETYNSPYSVGQNKIIRFPLKASTTENSVELIQRVMGESYTPTRINYKRRKLTRVRGNSNKFEIDKPSVEMSPILHQSDISSEKENLPHTDSRSKNEQEQLSQPEASYSEDQWFRIKKSDDQENDNEATAQFMKKIPEVDEKSKSSNKNHNILVSPTGNSTEDELHFLPLMSSLEEINI